MILTDTHTHLYYETDSQERQALMQRCLDNDITRLFLPNVNADSIPLVMALSGEYPENCFPMLGLHPCEVKDNYMQELERIEQAVSDCRPVAIGEIGIDLYWDKTTLAIQQDAFKRQIAWAKKLDLPIVIHCREAFDEVFEVLSEEKHDRLRGIFHCFTGSLEQARQVIALGFYLGIGGVVTYKNSGLDKVVAGLPLDHVVLETDAPYLSPVPFRGKPNESSYLIYVAKKLSEIKGIPLEEVAEITTRNSKTIFNV